MICRTSAHSDLARALFHIFVLPLLLLILVTPAFAQETRTFVDDAGHEVEVPVNPQRIVSMRGEQFSAPLIEMGANIVGSTGRTDEGMQEGRPYVRGAYHALDFRFEDSEVTWVGSPNEHDYEAVAAIEPDLIILPDFAADSYDKLSVIAPTVVIKVWGQSQLDRYRKVADVAGTLDEYERLLTRYRERLARARAVVEDVLGDPSEVSIAVASVQAEGLYVYRDYGTLSQVIRDLGFTTPEIISSQAEGNALLSVELLPEIDADFMIDTYMPGFGQTVSTQMSAWDEYAPGWRDVLHAVRHNQFFLIHRDEMRAVTFQSLRNTLDLVVSHIAAREFVPLDKSDQ